MSLKQEAVLKRWDDRRVGLMQGAVLSSPRRVVLPRNSEERLNRFDRTFLKSPYGYEHRKERVDTSGEETARWKRRKRRIAS